ncbi:hypothetical protein MKX01_006338 [Papaver californicum]|nr:hypothetical protein MKX01_006338 [Papaver californicum]
MKVPQPFLLLVIKLLLLLNFIAQLCLSAANDRPLYDSSAYTECKTQPEDPLYNGGVLRNYDHNNGLNQKTLDSIRTPQIFSPSFVLQNLNQATKYSFSSWVKINGDIESAIIRANFWSENSSFRCIGSVLAKRGCWSFLKGGFEIHSSLNLSVIYFQNSEESGIDISIASSSLQPFTDQQWKSNQDFRINSERKRAVTIHVSAKNGTRLQGAQIIVDQISKEFPFGSAIANTILGNLSYQKWFAERFNVAVFENELKWYTTEPEQGKLNYTLADQMLEFVRANQIAVRGHNIFWEDPAYTPAWVRNLTSDQLQSAVNSRIQSLMHKYRGDFIHWDVSNEMLHFDFYEEKLGKNATLSFFETAHKADPLATLFMNEFNVVETCSDVKSTVDTFISRLKDLKRDDIRMGGIGLEGHFSVPNLPLMRATLDKLATLGLPIWLTEVDISKSFDKQKQAVYLEQVLREAFSHPSVNGIMLWSAIHPYGCYQMCLTDNDLRNLPTGDVVDKLLQEWNTGEISNQTDEYGSFSFYGFLGEYKVSVRYGDTISNSTFSLLKGDETKHFNIQL